MSEDRAGNTDNTFQGIGNRLRLLKDFLLHVMRVRSERNVLAETLNNRDGTLNADKLIALKIVNLGGLLPNIGNIAVFEINITVGNAG